MQILKFCLVQFLHHFPFFFSKRRPFANLVKLYFLLCVTVCELNFPFNDKAASWHVRFDDKLPAYKASPAFHRSVASQPPASLFYFRRVSQTTDRRQCRCTRDAQLKSRLDPTRPDQTVPSCWAVVRWRRLKKVTPYHPGDHEWLYSTPTPTIQYSWISWRVAGIVYRGEKTKQ